MQHIGTGRTGEKGCLALRFDVVRVCFLVLPLLLGFHDGPTPPAVRAVVMTDAGGTEVTVRLQVEGKVRAFGQPRRISTGEIEIVLFGTTLHTDYRTPEDRRITLNSLNGNVYCRFRVPEGYDAEGAAYNDGTDVLMRVSLYPVRQGNVETPISPVAPPAGRTRWKLDTIVIDAGHGGKDPGATAHGVREKDVTLAVARKLGRMIESELGTNVVYTRTTDTFIELSRRGKIANQAGGKLFISIHVNAAPSSAATGTETFFLGMHKTEAARGVMERENSVVRLEDDQESYLAMDEQALILQTLANSAYMQKSEELAGTIERNLDGGRSSRGVKQAGFYVLWSASMPSVLVELGFVTNPREAAYLSSDIGQTTLASAIFASVRDFQAQYERELRLASGE